MRTAGANVHLAALLITALTTTAEGQGVASVSAANIGAVEARNRSVVEAAFAAWRDGTGSPYDLLAEDVSWTIVGRSDASKTYSSREAFLGEVIRPFNARMRAGLRPTMRSLHADGDTVIIFFDASGIARDGKIYANTYAWLWEMRDGRVTKAHAFFDSIAFNDLWRRVPAGTDGLKTGPVASSTPTER